MDRDHLAYLGAKERQRQIQQEAAELDAFILAYEGRVTQNSRRGRPAKAANSALPSGAPTTRKRKPMSAAQRKAVGKRMRKYWAQRRATQAKKR